MHPVRAQHNPALNTNPSTDAQIAQPNSSANPPGELAPAARIEQRPGGTKRVLTLSDPSGKELPSPEALPRAKRQKIDAQHTEPSDYLPINNLLNRNSMSSEQQGDDLGTTPTLTSPEGLNPSQSLEPAPSQENQPSSSAASTSTTTSSPSGLDPLAEVLRCLSTAIALLKNGQFDDAIQACQDGLKIKHNDPVVKAELFYGLGTTFYNTKKNSEAIEALQNGLKVEHTDPDLRARTCYNLGSVFYNTKQYGKAIEAYQNGLNIDHNDPQLNESLSEGLNLATIDSQQCAEEEMDPDNL
jgi:tetratricopeptide (TPR) repeat protein